MTSEPPKTFKAKILLMTINPYITVPKDISESFYKKGPIPVLVRINAFPTSGTLVPTSHERHRLYINNEMRKAAGIEIGDIITVSLETDSKTRDLAVPKPLARDLKARKVHDKFMNLTSSRRKEIIRYYNHLKTDDAKDRLVARIILILENRT